MSEGCLYTVAVPIGNQKDITLRAIETLQSVSTVICEEIRPAETLLKRLKILGKELLSLNEHTEANTAQEVAARIASGESMALISDAGTPVFSDPGHDLIAALTHLNIRIIPIPGASCLMAALSVCDFKIERFYYEGFLPRESTQRKAALMGLHKTHETIILMETPYRLIALLDDVIEIFGESQTVILACDITLETENILRGRIIDVKKALATKKCEYVLIIKQINDDRSKVANLSEKRKFKQNPRQKIAARNVRK
jgi:16S rRNA (cytidine1402-2'-O)-methyltransferase